MTDERLRPAEVAARLSIARNTLRVYSARFAPLLGEAAARPAVGDGGRPGHRLYTEADLEVLGRAHSLVSAGLTYEEALARLRGKAPDLAGRSARQERGGASIEARGEARIGARIETQLASLQQAVEAWRSLAEERGHEAGELRRRISGLEARLEGRDRGVEPASQK